MRRVVCLGRWVTLPNGQRVCIEDKGNKIAVGAAATLVVSALAGGGVGGTTAAAKGSLDQYSARTPKSESDAQSIGIRNGLRVTARLERLGYHVEIQVKQTDRNCADNSDGDVQDFFRTTECLSLYRIVYEIQAKAGTLLVSMATVVMPDEQSAIDLRALLMQATRGRIIPLVPLEEKYRHFTFVGGVLACTTRSGATVTTYEAKATGHTLGAAALDALIMGVLGNTCEPSPLGW